MAKPKYLQEEHTARKERAFRHAISEGVFELRSIPSGEDLCVWRVKRARNDEFSPMEPQNAEHVYVHRNCRTSILLTIYGKQWDISRDRFLELWCEIKGELLDPKIMPRIVDPSLESHESNSTRVSI